MGHEVKIRLEPKAFQRRATVDDAGAAGAATVAVYVHWQRTVHSVKSLVISLDQTPAGRSHGPGTLPISTSSGTHFSHGGSAAMIPCEDGKVFAIHYYYAWIIKKFRFPTPGKIWSENVRPHTREGKRLVNFLSLPESLAQPGCYGGALPCQGSTERGFSSP